MGRPRKKPLEPPAPPPAELLDVVVLPPPPDEGGLFDDLDDEASAPLIPYPTRPNDGIVMDEGLTPTEKSVFIRCLNEFLPPRERALQLAKLAMYTDTKRAAVGLRAIQEINALCGLHADGADEVTPMFALPPDTRVNVTITRVVK
jgi:hypothetical protein